MNVDITDLTRRFGRNQAVAGVNLQAGPGVFGLLGPNGAGKTTLLRMMATVIPPTSGRLRLLDRDPGAYGPRREVRRRLGYLPQNLGYYPGFTVAEFVEYFALLKEMPAARVPAEQPQPAGARRDHGGHHAEQRGLARSVRAEQAEYPGTGLQAHPRDGQIPAEPPAQIGDLDVQLGVPLGIRVA